MSDTGEPKKVYACHTGPTRTFLTSHGSDHKRGKLHFEDFIALLKIHDWNEYALGFPCIKNIYNSAENHPDFKRNLNEWRRLAFSMGFIVIQGSPTNHADILWGEDKFLSWDILPVRLDVPAAERPSFQQPGGSCLPQIKYTDAFKMWVEGKKPPYYPPVCKVTVSSFGADLTQTCSMSEKTPTVKFKKGSVKVGSLTAHLKPPVINPTLATGQKTGKAAAKKHDVEAAEESAVEAAEEPAVKPARKPAVKTAKKPAVKTARKPAVKTAKGSESDTDTPEGPAIDKHYDDELNDRVKARKRVMTNRRAAFKKAEAKAIQGLSEHDKAEFRAETDRQLGEAMQKVRDIWTENRKLPFANSYDDDSDDDDDDDSDGQPPVKRFKINITPGKPIRRNSRSIETPEDYAMNRLRASGPYRDADMLRLRLRVKRYVEDSELVEPENAQQRAAFNEETKRQRHHLELYMAKMNIDGADYDLWYKERRRQRRANALKTPMTPEMIVKHLIESAIKNKSTVFNKQEIEIKYDPIEDHQDEPVRSLFGGGNTSFAQPARVDEFFGN